MKVSMVQGRNSNRGEYWIIFRIRKVNKNDESIIMSVKVH